MSQATGSVTSFTVEELLHLADLIGERVAQHSWIVLVISLLAAVPVVWKSARYFAKVGRIIFAALEAALGWLDATGRGAWDLAWRRSRRAAWKLIKKGAQSVLDTANLRLQSLDEKTV
ncbi:hypothetical protein GCM10010520_23150 [Rhizobium viscosum]|uniref:Transmembrane protein n=1 Tax=Rhizobium viscosum TaxID=1673 RepID=A0ABR9IIU1_RHIVS|nr:hypothetical protein [Rhizobium viscosum]MBE1503088.1 hypothetical protein [Rhizobium viscosum]